MEFQFNLNEYLKKPIIEIKNTLLPPDFAGDRRALWNTVNKVAEIVNEMGAASAHAQGLNKPITTAERLRQTDQTVYFLVDQNSNGGNGVVTGMLKVGRKGLYVFDRDGQQYQVTPPCILDFYVHEKRQRSGLGKQLFEHMLQKENIKPHHLAIDRPSEKFLNFLNKHYKLQNPIRQMNNYVVFDGFFPESEREEQSHQNSPLTSRSNGLQERIHTHDDNTPFSQPNRTEDVSKTPQKGPMYGRYGAPRPPCSMGQIIHNTSSQKNNEPASDPTFVNFSRKRTESACNENSPKLERPKSLEIQQMENFGVQLPPPHHEEVVIPVEENQLDGNNDDEDDVNSQIEKLEIEEQITSADNDDEGSGKKTPRHLTEQGYFDLKFYHNKLW